MNLFGRRAPKPDKTTPFFAPEPEGPQEISARTERPKAGKRSPTNTETSPKDSAQNPAKTSSPRRRFLVGLVVVSQVALVATGLLTNFPSEWLLSLAFVLLTFLYPFEAESTDEEPETGESQYSTSSNPSSHNPNDET